ncbi:Membrane proteinase PrsW, cleaves anti-sigma factor RsiW, M82 family [Marivirga sericea]|uniref:Membrane proteinase PrsW, cleaves anti-sigma factor RsiW, M82 family n=1 Tax=Marivirga sericea TaxID=1028 RepID=A0A1X7LD14_9BACT|nr:PrsW family intramembrane metalloprotease [Marivirga sericea]SMG51748.1 Membrane proteinase PrsW, cleaves anti-sigma factor RsiW, M82 family [Marivirga sericea]
MVAVITYVFWIFFFLASFVGMKYSRSRNKKLFFQNGAYKAFVVSTLIMIVGVLLYFILPATAVDLSSFKLHSDEISIALSKASGFSRYWLKSLSIFTELNILGLISAILVTGIWWFYLRNLDFYNREKLEFSILGFVLGAFITFFTFPLSDFVTSTFSIEYSTNTFYNLFVYSFLGIGLVEELIKLIPVLIILKFTKEIDEPIDLIYYASISALGFAFIENLLYFRDISGSLVIGRALTSSVGHMIDSSIVVYGIILYKFRKEGFSIIPYYFLLGAFAHALYDYFLFEDLIFFFFASFAFFIQAWAIMINNAINNSKYFDYSVHYRHDLVRFRLALLLSLLMITSFVLNAFLVGREEALFAFMGSLLWCSLLIVFYVSYASSFDLFKGFWRPIKISFRSPSNQSLPGTRGLSTLTAIFTENTIIPQNHVGKKIKLHCPRFNKYLQDIFHIGEGKIKERIKLVSDRGVDPDWFVVKLDTPLSVTDDYNNSAILIKVQSKYLSLVHDKHIRCFLKLIPTEVNPLQEERSSEYISYGAIMINGHDYQYKGQN